MDILNQTYVKTVRSLGLEFVAGVAAFTAYGRDTRRKMMRSLFRRHQIREYSDAPNPMHFIPLRPPEHSRLCAFIEV